MRPDDAPWRRILRRVPASATQLWLEAKLLTHGRPWAPPVAALVWFGVFTLWALLRPEPWGTQVYYSLMLVAPVSIIVVGFGMGAVIGEQETRQLETTFISPTGRYLAWVHRLLALLLIAWGCAGALSFLTWLVIDRDHRAFAAWMHVLVPLLVMLSFTIVLSLVFKSTAGAGLASGAYLVVSRLFGGIARRLDYWFNPFADIQGVTDSDELFRLMVFNRSANLVLAGLFFTLAFWLLQRRERLL